AKRHRAHARRVRCASEGKQAKKKSDPALRDYKRSSVITRIPDWALEMPHAFDVRLSEFLNWPLNSIQFV
ncbi:hypothetical protein TNCV_2741081, partial [Trichonephila clavipes]